MALPLGLLANHTWYCLDRSFYQQASFPLWLNIGGALVEEEEKMKRTVLIVEMLRGGSWR